MSQLSPSRKKTPNYLVLWADIGGWSIQDAITQAREAKKISELALDMFCRKEKRKEPPKPEWRTSTGDGFALAFSADDAPEIMRIACNFFERVNLTENFLIRLVAAWGIIMKYKNDLIDINDICGPAIIKSRRIIESCRSGTFLIEDHLAKNLKGIDSSWDKSLAELVTPLKDKYGEEYKVWEYIAESRRESFVQISKSPEKASSLINLAKSLDCGPNISILNTAKMLGTRLVGIQGLLLLWLDSECRGLASDAIKIEPDWSRGEIPENGTPLKVLGDIDPELLEAITPIMKSQYPIKKIGEQANKPKVWIKKLGHPLTDKPYLELTLGGLDYRKARAIELAFTNQITWHGRKGTLREAYEKRELDIFEDLPNMVVAHIIMMTQDKYLVIAQRSSTVDYAQLTFSPSCEEQWNPRTDKYPHFTVLRALEEEFNLDSVHGVQIDSSNINLLAIGREWGKYWGVSFIYAVYLPCNAMDVIECWESWPKDKSEARAVILIPVGNLKDRKILWRQLISKEFDPSEYKAIISGVPTSKGNWHNTTAEPRVILGLSHWFGLSTIKKEVENL